MLTGKLRARALVSGLLASCAPPGSGGDSGASTPVSFALPLAGTELLGQLVGMDHDPEVHEGIERTTCRNYDGRSFPWCYDEHQGSDYLLAGGFETMDAGSVAVLAAAGGIVVETEDGHYDRCHGDLQTGEVDCDGHEQVANSVTIEHAGGVRTLYWHLAQGSVAVSPGQRVACGDLLGLVGSSGTSSAPHLHFELHDGGGEVVDPYSGEYSQPESWWVDQGGPYGWPGTACP